MSTINKHREQDATVDVTESIRSRLPEGFMGLNTAREKLASICIDKTISLVTMYRWTSRGCRGNVLKTISIGGIKCTNRDWIAEFFAALSEHGNDPVAPPVQTRSERQRSKKALDRKLDELGV